MKHDAIKIVALANGTIRPSTGAEVHFVRVIQGKALPSSQTENEWLQIFEASQNGGFQAHLHQDNSGSLTELEIINRQLTEQLFSKEKLIHEMRSQLTSFRDSLRKLNVELDVARALCDEEKRNLELSKNELEKNKLLAIQLTVDLNRQVEAGIDERHKVAEQEIQTVTSKNQRLAQLISELNSMVRKQHTKRITCPVCEGRSTYYDMSTYRTGANYDGPRTVDVCGNCKGAGFLENPERKILIKTEAEIADLSAESK